MGLEKQQRQSVGSTGLSADSLVGCSGCPLQHQPKWHAVGAGARCGLQNQHFCVSLLGQSAQQVGSILVLYGRLMTIGSPTAQCRGLLVLGIARAVLGQGLP